jgi:hypothetical protein
MALLPKQKTKPKTKLSSYTTLLYGPPKVGKTEFTSRFPDVLMLATEAGLTSLECYQVTIDSWSTFLDACAELAEEPGRFQSICIDTLDNLWAFCRSHVNEKHRVEHESDLNFGKGYSLVQSEFSRVLTKLSHMDFGLVMTSHCTVHEFQTRTGVTHRYVPTLPEKARNVVIGMSDLILFADTEVAQGPDGKPTLRRVLRTKPNPHYDAGDRTGRLPDPLPMDFPAFQKAFEEAVAGLIQEPAGKPSVAPANSKAGNGK